MSQQTRTCRPIALLCAAVAATTVLAGPVAPVTVTVQEDTQDHIVLHYELGAYTSQAVTIDGQTYALIQLAGESSMEIAGAPALPNVCRSVIIPDDAAMTLRVLAEEHHEVSAVVAPSKGPLPRSVNPADVPYQFGEVYDVDAFYPGPTALLHKPYIMRDHRGIVVTVNPFQYNPVSHTLRVYTSVTVELAAVGPGKINVLKRGGPEKTLSQAFHEIYEAHFINYGGGQRYEPLDEDGDMLVIAYDAWMSNVQPLVDHKNSIGIDTTMVGVSTIGNDATSIKNYIDGVYQSSDLAFVLLVGDVAQVTTPTAVSGYYGAADPKYSQLVGDDDYPEIIIGRISAENTDQVDTQVERTIEYELMPATTQDWFWKGTGIASSQGVGDDGEYDWEHIENIRIDLLNYGYTEVDQIYDPGASASDVTTALNQGRGIINYCGHGGPTSWSTTGFSNSHVNALVNDNMLPFIVTVACNNGQFDDYTCFAEAWLRATNGSEPTGAIGCYASSISQPWSPPMEGQDEFNLLYVAEAYHSYGALCYAGSCSMMDDYPGSGETWGTGPATFNTWILFGDPSLRVVMSCTDAGTLTLDDSIYLCEDTVTIQVVDCGLNLDGAAVDTAQVLIVSDTEPAGELVTVTELGTDTGQFGGAVVLSETDAAGVLQVSTGDTITVTYDDADDGSGSPAVVTAEAVVDCTPPNIWNVQAIDVETRSATVTFDADEIVRGTVRYGLSCDSLTEEATGSFGNPASVDLTGLQDETTYFYVVDAEDQAGNQTTDDNGGACYTFTTPEIPVFFTEQFSSGNDLDYKMLQFTPNETVDFYAGCVEDIGEFPTDPSGGTEITLYNDDYEYVSLDGGETVTLYGVAYDGFYIGSNGYITFGAGDTEYSESPANHFDLPRVSALFDNLNPSLGGTISWKQMSDRAVVTWENVPEVSSSNNNTFQIELQFNGDIRISYLTIDANDGLAGLSDGDGVHPDYSASDLSALGPCGPHPPTASDGEVSTPFNTAVQITLVATDDGLPEPSVLDYVISALPAHGVLSDPGAGAIDSVPYTLVDGGNELLYTPELWFMDDDSFQFYADDGGVPPEGGSSNTATVFITVTPPGTQPIFQFPLDSDPGWFTEGQWAFGQPTGGGSHNADPTSGYTGDNVYGYNLDGDYTTSMPEYYLTTTAIDCGELSGVELRFWRWLGVESSAFDHAAVEVSNDGTDWTSVWTNSTSSMSDSSWSQMTLDISDVADEQPTVYIRWVMGPTDSSVTYPGWNIDDVEICAVVPPIPGDLDGDGCVDLADLAQLLAHYGMTSGAGYGDGDLDVDGDVDLADLAELLAHYGEGCG